MEGATFALRYGVDRLGELGIEATEILLTGGGAGSPTWRQAVADICNAPVTGLQQNEGASFGAALQALSVLEQVGQADLQSFADQHLGRDEALSCEAKSSSVNFYNEAYQDYQSAVGAITPLYS
jgi:xylulokinase